MIKNTETQVLSGARKIQRLQPLTARVGIYGVGHHTYWEQFDGLLDKLKEKMDVFENRVANHGIEVINFGIGDNAESAYKVMPEIKAANLDLLFIDMLTYATSSSIGIIFKEIDVPMVMVALQPDKALDYKNATTFMQLYNDDICALPEFASVAQRMGKQIPPIVIGSLYDDLDAASEIADFCQIAKVFHDLKKARIGYFGLDLRLFIG